MTIGEAELKGCQLIGCRGCWKLTRGPEVGVTDNADIVIFTSYIFVSRQTEQFTHGFALSTLKLFLSIQRNPPNLSILGPIQKTKLSRCSLPPELLSNHTLRWIGREMKGRTAVLTFGQTVLSL